MLVHFPIALYCFEFLLLSIWLFKKDGYFSRFAYLTFKCAFIMTPVAMIAGYIDAGGITSIVRNHFFSAVAVLAINSIRFFVWRYTIQRESARPVWLWGSGLLSLVMVAVTADLGGDLVYHF